MTLVIVKRAYGNREIVKTIESGSWLEAMRESMAMEHNNNDGEYFVCDANNNPLEGKPAPYNQSGFDYL